MRFFVCCLLFCLMPGLCGAPPRLLAWYKLNGNFQDSSGNGHHLSSLNPDNPFSKDIYILPGDNKCFGPIAKASGRYGAFGPALPLSNKKGFTICGFAALPKQNSYHAVLFGCGKGDHRYPAALLYAPWGVINSKVGITLKKSGKRLNDGKWHHFALAVPPESDLAKADQYTLYIDGKAAWNGRIQRIRSYGNFILGLVQGKQMTGFKLDEVKVYDGFLSEAAIKKEAKLQGKRQPKHISQTGLARRTPPPSGSVTPRGKLKVHFLTKDWLCVVGNYNDFMRERFKKECGKFMRLLDTKIVLVPKWSYDFYYNYNTIDIISDYRPAIKKRFESKDNFTIRNSAGIPLKIAQNSYWINAVGQMRMPIVASGKMKMVNSAAVAHFAYLKVASPLRNGQRYIITTKAGEKVDFVYDESKIISWAIKVNQVGYLPDAGLKYGYLGSWLAALGPLPLDAWQQKNFYLIDDKSGKKVFTGKIELRAREQYSSADKSKRIPINGEDVYELDFSNFKQPGKYHLQIPGIGRSWSFDIGADAIGQAFYKHARGLYHQRSGIGKGPPHTNWIMGPDHMASWVGGFSPEVADYRVLRKDGSGYLNQFGNPIKLNPFDVVRETATKRKLPNVHGGWWDAADYDRRPYHFRIVQDLLSAWLMFPKKFSDGQLQIPESGNGIPDIVDEAAWGVEVWRRAQNKKGGVGCWLEADSHPKDFNPSTDKQRYYLALPTRHSTIQYAAHAALLARALKQCGKPEKANIYLKSAARAFAYAINPANRVEYKWSHYPRGNKKAVIYTYLEPPGLDQAMVFKAAYNLFSLTEKPEYKEYLTPARFDIVLRESEYPKTPFFMTEALVPPLISPKFTAAYKHEILRQAAKWLGYQQLSAYRNLNWPPWHHYFKNLAWGNAIPFNKGRYFIAAYRITGNRKYRDAALLLNDWLCGANPMGRTLTTGLGKISPARILSLASYSDGILEPLPGITTYTYTFYVEYRAKTMVYALRYRPRKDHAFNGVDICLMPRALTDGANLQYDQITNLMDKFYPVWRRFANIEEYGVAQNEFTVWETIGPCAACLGCLLPDGWMPPAAWKSARPAERLEQMKGYIFQP